MTKSELEARCAELEKRCTTLEMMMVAGGITPSLSITLPYPPSANRYWRRGGHVIYKSREATDYQNEVSGILWQRQIEPMAGRLSVRVDVYRKDRRRDLDNHIKVLLDAMQGMVYEDDNQIEALHMFNLYDPKNPRVEVELW